MIVRPVEPGDLKAMVDAHLAAFPSSALARLGPGAVARHHRWLLSDAHDSFGLVAVHDGEVLGFLIGGRFRGALSGFVRRHALYLAAQALRRPALWWDPRARRALGAVRRRQVGRSDVATSPATGPATDGIQVVAVHPSHHRGGVGSALMGSAEAVARGRGAGGLHLTVDPTSEAVAFYEALAFGRVGTPWTGTMRRSW